ncbi:YlbF family regulator [Staphylococcus americanisciuri]|uniref:YlbF family regulator n=1 Tax=Staphylococcus americanisciuri TaxID=2973940 RepID=A0ABT2F2S1_9STAP|nr:YlbF family regulator [Staphylococcus americanisciuri]MCS4486744.1 YlbF family regulator [Staphylococcus americanisciuri]
MFDEDLVKVLDETDVLAEMIQQSDIYQNYLSAKKNLDNDEVAQRYYLTFLKSKEQYDEVMRFGRYHPDYQAVMLETRRQKRVYDMHETVVIFKQCEYELQLLLDEVVTILASSVSAHVKVDAGTPLFNQPGCGCGSGNACQCQKR